MCAKKKKERYGKMSKGESSFATTESGIILTIVLFVAALIWFTQQMHTTFPEVEAFPDFSFILFGTEIIAVAVACNVVTGLACVGAGVFAGFVNFFFIPPIYQIVMFPMMALMAYVMGRLMRGGG